MNDLWQTIARDGGVELTGPQHVLLAGYIDELLAANQRMNLTRIAGRAQAEVHHVADALTLLKFIPAGGIKVIDIGSGGGVPGIPVAIARPDASVTLVESTKKKAAFLRDCATALGLANVTVLDQRAEDVGQGPLRESLDVATARAVATLDWLAEWCLPLVRKGGKVLAMKGQRVTEEVPAAMKAIRTLAGADPVVHPVQLPGTEHHVIVEICKLGTTDRKYPRPATIAKGKPIG
jgi:16S rRNA (guanine527-N7)-methyltransferase